MEATSSRQSAPQAKKTSENTSNGKTQPNTKKNKIDTSQVWTVPKLKQQKKGPFIPHSSASFVTIVDEVLVSLCTEGDNSRFVCSAKSAFGLWAARESGKPKRRNSSKKDTSKSYEYAAYRFAGYPTPEQAQQLAQNCGACRYIWNHMLADKLASLDATGAPGKQTPASYKKMKGLEWLKNVDSYGLCNVQLNLESAFSDWFSGKTGKPSFKKKGRGADSYTTNKDTRSNNISLTKDGLILPKISEPIKLIIHRTPRPDGTLKKVTVTHEPDGNWFFSIVYEYIAGEAHFKANVQDYLDTGDTSHLHCLGLDMSLPKLYIDSDGNTPSYTLNGQPIEFEKQFRKREDKLAKEQHKLSLKIKDSANYQKQKLRVAELYAKAKHSRSDFLHQMAVRLAREYDVIAIENLDIEAMKKSLQFGKSVSDNGWGMFVDILERKCEEEGSLLVFVDKWFPSSKTCSRCHYVHKELKLEDRTYVCPCCGHTIDRDENAAINIRDEALRILADNMRSNTDTPA